MENDPYRAEAGLELDAVIHARLMKQTVPAGSCPADSSDDQLAKQVLARLRMGKPSVIVGRTSLPGRTWFARQCHRR